MFFQNLFWNPMQAINQFQQERNCFVTCTKELIVQRFV